MMATKNLLQELAELNNSAAPDFDPEQQGLEDNVLAGVKTTRRTARLSEDPKYHGFKATRASLRDSAYNDNDNDEPMQYKPDSDVDQNENESDGNMDSMDEEDESDDNDFSDQGESLTQYSSKKLADDLEAMEEEEEAVLKSLSQDVSAQQRKGVHAQHQLKLWESTLETRIRLQKALAPANRLPLPETYGHLMVDFDDELEDCLSSLHGVASELLQLQVAILGQSDDLLEAIPDTLACLEVESEGLPIAKRALLIEEALETDVQELDEGLHDYQDRIITKWNHKTRLASGRAGKGFKALDKSVLQQVDEAMAQPERLISRTQTKRFEDRIVGYTPEVQAEASMPVIEDDVDEKDIPAEALAQTQRQRAQAQEVVVDIFDDTDYYHDLLRELIDRKTSSDSMDMTEMGRHFVQIDRLRAKNKKRVDTKASKGRKIRYDVHSKLVNIMAPNEQAYAASDQARDTLFRSLFGQ
eukprot:TRINITY_DN11638_c3_g1_i1.p1 TRINITY_DN11638_c3_g1~~TRINITY_DN11638_c3_g1_i1.p1  ORF type:complete len:471 (+),score=92.42 TRINITY_DN11638_c3_g1_i1:27-1439(+)